MKILHILALASGAAVIASCASTAPMVAGAEATILSANRNGITDFEPVSDQVVFLRGRNGNWYRAELFAPCIGLDRKVGIAYDTNPDGSFDRSSAIRVNGQRCAVMSLVHSGPPPERRTG